MSFDITEHFSTYFTLSIANTPVLKREVFKIRYQVYCEELGYESKEKFPEQMEQDDYDLRSVHCLLKHKPSEKYVGCVRIVLPEPQAPHAPFPFEKICSHHFDFNHQPRSLFCEISRLAVIAQFRQRKGESETSAGLIFTEEERSFHEKRRFPLIALSLYLASMSVGARLSLQSGFSLMEPRLARHLRCCGIPSHQVGDLVEFRGKRGPFLLNRQEILENMVLEIYRLYKQINQELETWQVTKFKDATSVA